MWQPVLEQWEAERKRQYMQQLEHRIVQLENENRDLQVVVHRAQHVLERLRANPTLIIGGDVCQHSELTSVPPLP